MLKSDYPLDQELIRKISKKIAEERVDEEVARHPNLHSEREKLQKVKEEEVGFELTSSLVEVIDDLKKAGEFLVGWFENLPPEKRDQLRKEFQRASQIFDSEWFQDQLKRSIENPVEKGSPLQKLLKLSDSTLQTVYEAGVYLQKEADFLTSRAIFRFLAFINPNIADFWNCLGFCFSNLRNYEEAERCFLLAKDLSPDEPDSFYFSAVNSTLQHDYAIAMERCEQCLAVVNGHEHLQQWKVPVSELTEYIQSKRGGVIHGRNNRKYRRYLLNRRCWWT